jgi:hypothetical protein
VGGDFAGETALWAASQGKIDAVRCLLKLHADVNQATSFGMTPLMAASFDKYEEGVVWLVKAGADTQATFQNSADTAVDLSRRTGASASQTAYLEAKTHCSNPSCSGAGILKCHRCKQARYCGQACGDAHWKAHKADCKRWSAELEVGKGEGKS